jgi:hypothetical protein
LCEKGSRQEKTTIPSIYHRCEAKQIVDELKNDIDIGIFGKGRFRTYPPNTYYWTDLLILDHSYFVWNLTNSKIAETKALEPLKS